VLVTRFHVQWNGLFTGSKQKLIVILYLAYLLLSIKDSVIRDKLLSDSKLIVTLDVTLNVP